MGKFSDAIASAFDTSDGNGYEPLPAGNYAAVLEKGGPHENANGTPSFRLTFRVADGEHAGRLLWRDLWLTSAAVPYTKRDAVKIGINRSEQLAHPLPQRFRCEVAVKLRKGDDGKLYNEVRDFNVIEALAADSNRDPFAPKESGGA